MRSLLKAQWVRFALGVVMLSASLNAQAQSLTVLHTNDWQSRFLGFGPNAEYTPETLNDDSTVGGLARLATLISERRTSASSKGAVLLLDGGDFSMGTLFHTITRETGAELQLMTRLGYDAVTLGNHEFDFRPDGLAQMFRSANSYVESLVPVVTSNLAFDPDDPADDSLQEVVSDGLIRDTLIIEKNGLKIGLFGLIGFDAAEVAPNKAPVTITDQVATAQSRVKQLREEGVDLVILLSHMGVLESGNGTWGGEEVDLVKQVPGIDLVIGGHSHTPLHDPVMVNGTPIVQAGSEGQYLGELQLEITPGEVTVMDYILHPIDDRIAGDPEITELVEGFKEQVTQQILQPAGYYFDQALTKIPRTLTREYEDRVLGNLVTDGLRVASGADIALTGNGTIRDEVWLGDTGIQSVSDLFRLEPLGIGEVDDSPGYPLMKVWFTGSELKSIFEVLLLGYQLRGDSYYPRVSGVRFTFNNYRPPFDRVMSVEVGSVEGGYHAVDLSGADDRLYSIGGTTYVGSFTWLIDEISYGLLSATPKNQHGQPVADIKQSLIDGDTDLAGVQEIKSWKAIIDHLAALPDINNDGLADVVINQNSDELRIIPQHSLAPSALMKNAGAIAKTVYFIIFLLLILSVWLLLRFYKGRRKTV